MVKKREKPASKENYPVSKKAAPGRQKSIKMSLEAPISVEQKAQTESLAGASGSIGESKGWQLIPSSRHRKPYFGKLADYTQFLS